ncbi:hypothetical protein [Mycolicibacter icosiumassiliensis]|uniref:hypothetical protein n=1 Tax=Mycolicibacter icosiumassiliensis TaxID=1792835 RepID=UPI000ABB78AA|nr:hypothetical protein [Mycolicibacter icosiumassiliensis]
MTDHELAEQLFAVVKPDGFGIKGELAAGEYVAAIIDLVEQAALRPIPLPQGLVDAVAEFADDPALDPDDIAAIREDLATIAAIRS